jgi:hypothetical protein
MESIKKAEIFIVKGFDLEEKAVLSMCEGLTCNKNSFRMENINGVFSVKTDCLAYKWTFYVEDFFGHFKITRVFEAV